MRVKCDYDEAFQITSCTCKLGHKEICIRIEHRELNYELSMA